MGRSDDIIQSLKQLGGESYKKILLRHGVNEPVFGVKIEELKKIQKREKKNHVLAMELYASGNYDAQYLAGLIADETKMSKADLKRWIKTANCAALCDYTVAGVAAESPHGLDLAMEWIDSKDPTTAQTGWTTLSKIVGMQPDDELDLPTLKKLVQRVGKTIHQQPDRVRYTMNGFLIAVGIGVAPLNELAMETAKKIGKVDVDMGDTACKVPFAPDYIEKARKRGVIGKKRPAARC